MNSIGTCFKELLLAYDIEDRYTIVMNLKKIFRVYYGIADSNDLCYCGLVDLLSFLTELSDKELHESNVWNSFEDGGDSPLLQKVVENGLDMFKVEGAW